MSRAEKYANRLSGLTAAVLAVGSGPSLAEGLQLATDQARELFGAHQAVVRYLGEDPDRRVTVLSVSDRYQAHRESAAGAPCSAELPEDELPFQQDEPLRLTATELARHPVLNQLTLPADRPPLRGLLAAPLLRRDGTRLGSVRLSDKYDDQEFDEQDQELLAHLAQLLAGAIEQDERVHDARRQVAEMAEREEHYRLALDSADIGTFEHDLSSDREVWSDSLRRLYGVDGTPEASYQGWLEIVHPADRELANREVQETLRERRDRFVRRFRVIHPRRGVRWMLSRGRVSYDASGAATRIIGTVMDVTHHKVTELRLAQRARQQAVVAQLGHQALAGVDPQHLMDEAVYQVAHVLGVEYCSVLELLPGGQDLLLRSGVGWQEDLVGRARVPAGRGSQAGYTLLSRGPVVVEDVSSDDRFREVGLLGTHRVVSGLSVIIYGENGPWGVLSGHATSRVEFSSDDVYFVESVANVLAEAIVRLHWEERLEAARAELEERVAERTAQLETSNRELEAFAYSVSHDLRAPLRGLDGFSQALLEDYGPQLDDTAREYLQRVRGAARRMGELIDDLLSLSRVSSIELRRTVVDLSHKVVRIAEELCYKEPGREVRFDIAPDVTVRGDPRLLRILMENLIGNSWKFTRGREGTVISFGVVPEREPRVFYVRDNGIGFDMAYSGRLFTPFQRLHPTSQFEGTGIGLATVQRIVYRHGGAIWAESQPDVGTTLYFTLEPGAAPS